MLNILKSQYSTINFGYYITPGRFLFKRSCLWPLAEIASTGDQVLIATERFGHMSYQIDTNPMSDSLLYFNQA